MTPNQYIYSQLFTRAQTHPEAPRYPAPIGIDSLDAMVGKHIRWEYTDRTGIRSPYTGVVIDWFQKEFEGAVHTWLLVASAGWREPVWVYSDRFLGFSNPFMGGR